tara:strand:+ start:554 stop:1387 length:834 start_codon:yes stop_codon:yes gene_type:complete
MSEKKLLTVGDLRKWCNQIYDDHAQIAVTVPLKDIDGYVVNVSDVHYDETSEALILEPCYDQVPDGETFSLSSAAKSLSASPIVTDDLIFRIEALEKALLEIASYEVETDECPEWYKDHTLEGIHEDDPDYVKMLAWDKDEWYWAWREDHGHEDSEHFGNSVNIARNALLNNIKGNLIIKQEVNDGFSFDINGSLFGKARWMGNYFMCWHTDGVANDNYLMFEEVDDAKAYLQWLADVDELQSRQFKTDAHYFPMPEAPKAKNTGEDIDPYVEFHKS